MTEWEITETIDPVRPWVVHVKDAMYLWKYRCSSRGLAELSRLELQWDELKQEKRKVEMEFHSENKITRVSDAVALGATDVNSASIQPSGMSNEVTFLVIFGAITDAENQIIKLQCSSDDGASDAFADLAGTAYTVGGSDDNKIAYLTIRDSAEKYIRCVVDRGATGSAIDGILAIESDLSHKPMAHDSTTVKGGETHIGPAEGTA